MAVRYARAKIACLLLALGTNQILANEASQKASRHQTISNQQTLLSSQKYSRLPTSRLNLVLSGIVISTQKRALISVEGSQDYPFAVGDTITGEVVLVDVHKDGAILRHNGTLTRLDLQGRSRTTQDISQVHRTPVPVQNMPPILSASVTRPIAEDAVKHRGDNSYVVAWSTVKEHIDSSDLLAHAKLISLPDGGHRMIEIVPESLYDRLGFKDGDVIRTVNGKSVRSIFDLAELYTQRETLENMKIEIIRAGNPENMEYRLR